MKLEYVKFIESVKDTHQEGFRAQTIEHKATTSDGKTVADIRLEDGMVWVKSLKTGQVVGSPLSNVRFLLPAREQQAHARGK